MSHELKSITVVNIRTFDRIHAIMYQYRKQNVTFYQQEPIPCSIEFSYSLNACSAQEKWYTTRDNSLLMAGKDPQPVDYQNTL